MDIASLIVSEKQITAEYPDPALEGFTVELAFLGRPEIQKLRAKCVTMKYDKKTHRPEEALDEDLFLKLYVGKVIRGWTGLKASYLAELMPVDVSAISPDSLIEYTPENAVTLMKNAAAFDSWISNIVSDLAVFNKNSLSTKETNS